MARARFVRKMPCAGLVFGNQCRLFFVVVWFVWSIFCWADAWPFLYDINFDCNPLRLENSRWFSRLSHLTWLIFSSFPLFSCNFVSLFEKILFAKFGLQFVAVICFAVKVLSSIYIHLSKPVIVSVFVCKRAHSKSHDLIKSHEAVEK